MNYIEFVTNDVRNRGHFIESSKYRNYVNANFGIVMYKSYYLYDDSAIDHVKAHGTITGYDGPRYFDEMILDIDCKEDMAKAAAVALEIHSYLIDYHELEEHNVQIWFSGSKGFHIHMPANVIYYEPGLHLPSVHKQTIESLFGKWLEHVDTKPFQKSGLIRCPWSLHKRTGNVKVPVSISQLNDFANNKYDDVPEFVTLDGCKQQFDVIEEPMDDANIGVFNDYIVTVDVQQNYQQEHDMDKPNSMVTCMQKLLLRGPEEGRRHQDTLRLVSNWRRQGIPQSYALTMLTEWLNPSGTNADPDDFKRIVRDVYKQGYAYSCNDEVMAEFCDSKCIFFKKKNYTLEVKPGSAMQDDYRDYLLLSEQTSIDIVRHFGLPGSYKIYPGTMTIVTGDTGAGKTALVQDFLVNHKLRTLYFNLEMHPGLIYRRFLQCELHKSKHEIDAMMNNGIDFEPYLQWLDFVHTSPEINDIDRLIANKDYEVIVVDTSDGVSDPSTNNEYVALGNIIQVLMAIAQNRNAIVILIHHIKKRGGRKSITLDDLLGNRANVTKMDHVFVIEGEERYKVLRSLKTRDDSPIELHLNYNYSNFKFTTNDRYEQQFSNI